MRRVLLAIVTTVTGLVMLLLFKTQSVQANGTAALATPPSAVRSTTAGSGTSTTTSSGTSTTTSGSTATKTATPTAATRTITGSSVDTRWGPVQVQITVKAGKITSAVAVVYPENNGRDQQINAYAIPVLEQETVQADSASIDMVSGATYTSTGYINSLQSALNQL